MQLASNAALDDGCRSLALELVVGLCEQAPGMMRKLPDLVPLIVPVCLKVCRTKY
jgi:hypothetical protein